MRLFIGVDPGLTGALASISDNRLLLLADLPIMARGVSGKVKNQVNPAALSALFRELVEGFGKNETIVAIELMGAMPGQGVSSTLSIGLTAGLIEGVVAAAGLRYELVRPSKWKKSMALSADKEQARAAAIKMFPEADLKLKKHHNRAEAILLAEWARRGWE